jgi:hypothetical protein
MGGGGGEGGGNSGAVVGVVKALRTRVKEEHAVCGTECYILKWTDGDTTDCRKVGPLKT